MERYFMDDVTREVVQQWVRKAENDLQNIQNNICAEEIPADTVCFHAQQAIEKVLKAVLIANGRTAGKTHDLVKLLTDVLEFIPELAAFEERLEEISEYGVAARYPTAFNDPTLGEASRAYETAKDLRQIILCKIEI